MSEVEIEKIKKEKMKYDVYYPDGDFKCQVNSFEEAKKESKGFASEDIREVEELMTDEELVKCKAFLDYFYVKYDGETIKLTDGGNSCIMNPNTEWKEFLGYSINSVSMAVARKLGKKTEWEADYF